MRRTRDPPVMSRRAWISSIASTLLLTRLRRARARAPVGVALGLRWNSEVVAHALVGARARTPHVIASERVAAITVTATVGDERIVLGHEAGLGFVDRARGAYAARAVDSALLSRLLDRGARLAVDLRFTYLPFFDEMLAEMTRTDAELRNLAHPDDPDRILRTFDHELSKDKVSSIVYRVDTHRMRDVPCRLVDASVTGQGGTVELQLELDVHARTDMRRLIAMDWSELALIDHASAVPPHAEIWKANLLGFLANQTSVRRAERFRTTIAKRHATKAPRQLAEDLRDDIDLYLITGNHWQETREDPVRERYQALMANVLETLDRTSTLASPIMLCRELSRRHGLDSDERAALVLQYGTGHCGEHGRVSFSVLRTIMSVRGNHIDSIVLCENANIDHAFVLCNLQVTHVLRTTTTSPRNQRYPIGQDIHVFNLRDALAANHGKEAYVVDPYLDPSMIPRTGRRLLLALNSERKQRAGMDTDYLAFVMQYPSPHNFTIEDIRQRPAAERMQLVKNV